MRNPQHKALMMGMLLAMATEAQRDPSFLNSPNQLPRRKSLPKGPPQGATEYHYSESGEVSTKKNETTVFSCVARNEENAYRKFVNFRRSKAA